MNIGWVGLGAMGSKMAPRLLAAGHAVKAYDLRESAIDAFVDQGGQAAHSVAQAAQGVDVLWLMVVSGDQARQVLFDQGAADALSPNAVVVAACTQPPAQAQRLAKDLAERGIGFLDAPVSGGTKGAAAGTLSIMVGGDPALTQRLDGPLKAMAGRIFQVGPEPGMGSTAKMVNQLLCGVHIAAAAEAMHVAERAGIALPIMHEIVSVSAGNSWMWGDRGPRMMQDDPEVTSAVDIFVKDLGIVLSQGEVMRAGLPLAAAARQMFLAASGLGHGAADDSQVIRAYRALNGRRAANDA